VDKNLQRKKDCEGEREGIGERKKTHRAKGKGKAQKERTFAEKG